MKKIFTIIKAIFYWLIFTTYMLIMWILDSISRFIDKLFGKE